MINEALAGDKAFNEFNRCMEAAFLLIDMMEPAEEELARAYVKDTMATMERLLDEGLKLEPGTEAAEKVLNWGINAISKYFERYIPTDESTLRN